MNPFLAIGVLLLMFLGILIFMGWQVAKGRPKGWDRDTFVLAYVALTLATAALFGLAQHWDPSSDLQSVLRDAARFGCALLMAVSFGLGVSIFTVGLRRPSDKAGNDSSDRRP